MVEGASTFYVPTMEAASLSWPGEEDGYEHLEEG